MTALAVAYDPDVFDGIDVNQGRTWLDVDGDTHRIADMLVTERLSAAGELETMAGTLPGGDEMVRRSRLYLALLWIHSRDAGADLDSPHVAGDMPAHLEA